MTESTALFVEILDLLSRLGVDVRQERLGGAGGGLCTIRGKSVLFLDLDADLATLTAGGLDVLAPMPEVDSVYVSPALRERIEQRRG